jgi:hypothetical protein
MSFGIYAIGYAIVICGLIYAANLMHVPTHWIVAGAIVFVGLGILSGVKATRQKDSVS